MSYTTTLATFPKQEIAGSPGPPFAATSADNGLSVDPISGRIVLGGGVGAPSALLDGRFIDTAGFLITFQRTGATAITQVSNAGLTVFDLSNSVNAGVSSLGVFANNTAAGDSGVYSSGQWSLSNNASVDSVRCFTNDFVFFDNVTNANRIHLRRVVDVLQFTPDSFVPMFTFGINTGDLLATGTVTTGQPSASGAGALKFGKIIAAASVLDGTRYWETQIDGVTIKVALIA